MSITKRKEDKNKPSEKINETVNGIPSYQRIYRKKSWLCTLEATVSS